MKKNSQLILVLILLFGMLVAYNNCKISKKEGDTSNVDTTDSKGGGSENVAEEGQSSLEESSSENKDTEEEVDLPSELEVSSESIELSTFGVKTGEELLESLSLVTGIPYRYEVEGVLKYNEEIFFTNGLPFNQDGVEVSEDWLSKHGVFQQVRNNLPVDSSMDKFNSSNLNAITSLSSVFCEQLFKDNHPITGEPFASTILVNESEELFDLSIENPTEQDVSSLNSIMVNKFIPHVDLDQNGIDILNNGLQSMVVDYEDLKSSSKGFISTGGEGNLTTVSFGGLGTGSEDFVDMNQDWFISHWVQPIDIENGVGTWQWGEFGSRPLISIESNQLYINFAISALSGHDIEGHVYFIDFVSGVHRHGVFEINSFKDNYTKLAPYHIVFQYKNNENASIEMNEDFQIYLNGKKIALSPYKGNDGYWPESPPISKNNILFPSTASGEFSIRSRSDIPMGHFELYKGQFEDFIVEDEISGFDPLYNFPDGGFRPPSSEADLLARNPVFYFGMPDANLDKFVTFSGGTLTERVNTNLYRNDRSSWLPPLKMLGPLSCTAILASQYFIFY